jgi:dolichol-phosphate mannosyltransferase
MHEFSPDLAYRRDPPRLVTIVVPAMNEQENLAALHAAVKLALEGYAWELVVVDDGSQDGTFDTLCALSGQDSRVRGLALSRNFGQQYALLAGMQAARGDVVVTLDADLQHPPSLIPTLIERWKEGYNVVHTRRLPNSQTGFLKRKTSDWYYRLLAWFSGVKMEAGQSDFRLLDRRVTDSLCRLDEAQLFLRGLILWVGYRSTTVPFEAGMRHAGTTKYTLRRMVRLGFQGLTSFSSIPLKLGLALGFATSIFAFLEIGYVIWIKLKGIAVPGWASLAGLVSLLFGINFLLLGFLGIYIGHIFQRVQRHPPFLIDRTTEEFIRRPGVPPEPSRPTRAAEPT